MPQLSALPRWLASSASFAKTAIIPASRSKSAPESTRSTAEPSMSNGHSQVLGQAWHALSMPRVALPQQPSSGAGNGSWRRNAFSSASTSSIMWAASIYQDPRHKQKQANLFFYTSFLVLVNLLFFIFSTSTSPYTNYFLLHFKLHVLRVKNSTSLRAAFYCLCASQ